MCGRSVISFVMSRLSLSQLPIGQYHPPTAHTATPHRAHANAYHTPAHTRHIQQSPQQQLHHPYTSRTPYTGVHRPSPPAATPARKHQQQHRCASCGSTALRENDLGFFACTDCGAQSQDHMAITQEVEEEMFGNMQRILRTGSQ